MSQLKTIQKGAVKVFKSKPFWTIIILLIVFFVVRRWWDYFTDKIKPLQGDFASFISESRKQQLTALCGDLQNVIYGSLNFEKREDIILQVLTLNDSELLFLNNYYNKNFGNMIQDLDNEWMPFTDADERIISRLNAMGLY